MKPEKHIIWIAPEFYPLYTGHGIYLQKLAPFLERKGYKFTVLTTKQSEDVKEEEILENIKVIRLDCVKNGKINFLTYSLQAIKYLWQKKEGYEVIHIHGFFDRFGLFGLFSKIFNKNLIMQMVLIGVDDPDSCIGSFKFQSIRKNLFKMIDTFITISSPLTTACKNFGLPDKKIVQIPQGVNEKVFFPTDSLNENKKIKQDFGIPTDHRIAIFVGAIIERKGVRELLAVWKNIQSLHNDVSLVLVGPFDFGGNNFNSFANEMQLIAKELGNVHFIGPVDNVEFYLKASDLFVFPSKKEGFGNVIIEAMACQLPCIVTEMDGVGYDTVVNEETGYIVKNQRELEDRINGLLTDNDKMKEFGLKGMARAHKHFRLAAVADMYQDVYVDSVICESD
ncbi:MAG: glycosyltransferase involved in cell wall biosynthesis [bacterium]|jgi:glycosyltransferase involved in cell wall biosynthesis|uniref:glycosyltransferase family 4 protein n=1 Tax=Colwellia sp. BRX8-4 TaxID=2759836 RepID=UPI0015F61902|nr:glycosyltransferase family 4 protein [Colwellia sp. BRX8-4]MBA6363593.1 glycosyltransferase family 4 protein [Colwellia sp. BRX8-8]MBA6372143.1 glycosyltransferase family 4 protein [Colwellia sp. BRX8-4]